MRIENVTLEEALRHLRILKPGVEVPVDWGDGDGCWEVLKRLCREHGVDFAGYVRTLDGARSDTILEAHKHGMWPPESFREDLVFSPDDWEWSLLHALMFDLISLEEFYEDIRKSDNKVKKEAVMRWGEVWGVLPPCGKTT